MPPASWDADPIVVPEQRLRDAAPSTERTAAGVGEKKSLGKAYLWWFPLGIFGAHHFYIGRKVWGWITALTLNFLLLGWILDGILMPYWLSNMKKERAAREEMKQIWARTASEIRETWSEGAAGREVAGQELRALGVMAAKGVGPATAAASSWISQAVRLGGLALSRDRRQLSYGAQAISSSEVRVNVTSGVATSRVSSSNLIGGAVLGGLLGHAGAGAIVGATARTNTTRIYIVVDFPGGQWVAETSHKNERYARRFAAKVNSL